MSFSLHSYFIYVLKNIIRKGGSSQCGNSIKTHATSSIIESMYNYLYNKAKTVTNELFFIFKSMTVSC